jgi:hypothetical protein
MFVTDHADNVTITHPGGYHVPQINSEILSFSNLAKRVQIGVAL